MSYMKQKAIEELNDRKQLFSNAIDSISESLEVLKDLIGYSDNVYEDEEDRWNDKLHSELHENEYEV